MLARRSAGRQQGAIPARRCRGATIEEIARIEPDVMRLQMYRFAKETDHASAST